MAQKRSSDDDVERMLHETIGRYQEILFKAANTKRGESWAHYQKRFFQALDGAAITVRQQTQGIINSYIPSSSAPNSALLKSFGANYGGEEVKLTTYVRIVNAITESVNQYKDKLNTEIIRREKDGRVTTVMDLHDIINEDLKNDDVTVVRYANGAKMPVDKYADMLARTSRAETENLAMIQQALREGLDLVECDVVSPTCDICAVYQNRRYSISGKSSHYPALYKTAFKSGYSIIHPICRHSWSPVHEEMYTDEENREMLDFTHRSWEPDRNGVHFQQGEKAREEYARGEQLMRQWNSELVDYERMKASYKEKGMEPPYKTLGAYRREVRKPPEKQSPVIQGWKKRGNDEQQYERWKNIVGEKNVPETLEKFQGMKYNKDEKVRREFDLLRQYKETVETDGVTNIGFKAYQGVMQKATKEIVGINTSDGKGIKSISKHLVDRIIGSEKQKRLGVSIEEVVETIEKGTIVKQTEKSIKYRYEDVEVSVNPVTGNVIQCNPYSRGKK